MIGPLVFYVWRPGQVRAGQTQSIALVTKENADKTVNLSVFPDGSPDALFLKNVPAQSQEIAHHCFVQFPNSVAALEQRVSQLENDLVEMLDRVDRKRKAVG